MQFVILDLEWNGTYSEKRQGFINEIIEFGAVKTDSELNILDTFHRMVKPQIGKKLNGKVQQLTQISYEELASGSTFLHVSKEFSQWLGKDHGTVLMTWGTGDLLTLIDNYKYFSQKNNIPFLQYYLDLQAFIQKQLCLSGDRQLGLLPAVELLEVSMKQSGLHHRALDDSIMAYACLKAAAGNLSQLSAAIQTADKEFYRKLTFKTLILNDLNHPFVDRTQMCFNCDICERCTEQKTDWELRHKVFYAKFYCPHCDRNFYGKIQFRLKYEGLFVWKRTAELKEATSVTCEDKKEKKN